jgi:hypothetical protein
LAVVAGTVTVKEDMGRKGTTNRGNARRIDFNNYKSGGSLEINKGYTKPDI